ncbi:MAG: LptF/LptG family permease [Nitrospirae bacterium]|nr:LptF/LptG family permease [Nitrospirota bacterium]
MNSIERLYVKEFIVVLLTITSILSAVMGVFEIIDKLEKLTRFNPGAGLLLEYWLCVVPKYLKYLLPMAALISTLLVFGQASRYNELTAVKSFGMPVKKLFTPFIVIGLLLSLMDFVVDSYVASPGNAKANNILYRIKNKRDRFLFKTGDIWFMENPGTIVNAEIFVPEAKLFKNIKIFVFKNGRLAEMLTASDCKWERGVWVVSGLVKYDLGRLAISRPGTLKVDEIGGLKVYDDSVLLSDEMSFSELYRYSEGLKRAGYNNQKVMVDFHSKIAYPLTCMVMMLMGIVISSRLSIGSGTMSVAIAIAVGLFYWIVFAMAISLGYSAIVPAFVATWSVPAAFTTFGLYLYRKIPQ